jgi:hypothetical protein
MWVMPGSGYYIIDPWRNLSDWNKPLNVDNQVFELVYREAMDVTHFAEDRIVVLRGCAGSYGWNKTNMRG